MKSFYTTDIFDCKPRGVVYCIDYKEVEKQGHFKKKEIIKINTIPFIVSDIEIPRPGFLDSGPRYVAVMTQPDVLVKHDDVTYNLQWPSCLEDFGSLVRLTDDKIVPIDNIQPL